MTPSVLRLSPHCGGSPVRDFTAAEENQAWEEAEHLVSKVVVYKSVFVRCAKVVFLVSFGALLRVYVELQELKFILPHSDQLLIVNLTQQQSGCPASLDQYLFLMAVWSVRFKPQS